MQTEGGAQLRPLTSVTAGRAQHWEWEDWPSPVVLLHGFEVVSEMNLAARECQRATRLLSTQGGRIERLGQLSASDLRRWLQTHSALLPPPLGVWSWHAAEIHTREVHLFSPERIEGGGIRARWPQQALLVLTPAAPAVHKSLCLEALARVHQLTRTEARVLALVADGLEAHAVALVLGVKVSTVRTHLAALLAKTRSRRAAELIRLVWEGRTALPKNKG